MHTYIHVLLTRGSPHLQPSHPPPTSPLFVTWEKEQPASSRSLHLRGCIGTLSPRPLEALGDYVHSRCALRGRALGHWMELSCMYHHQPHL